MSEEWAKYGLLCHSTPVIQSLRYEAPVNLMSAVLYGECSIGAFTYLNGASSYTNTDIGRYCSASHDVVCGPGQHHTSALSTHPFIGELDNSITGLARFPSYAKLLTERNPTEFSPRPKPEEFRRIRIGHDVWIGTKATIMPGKKIGHGAVVATGAVVTHDVDPYTIVGGVPARPIKTRFAPEIIERLLELAWWDYDLSPVIKSIDPFNIPECIEILRHTIKKGIVTKLKPECWKMTKNGAEIIVEKDVTEVQSLTSSIETEIHHTSIPKAEAQSHQSIEAQHADQLKSEN